MSSVPDPVHTEVDPPLVRDFVSGFSSLVAVLLETAWLFDKQLFLARPVSSPTVQSMNRESESRLLAFCVEQRSRFNATAWMEFSALAPLELAAAARYLAGVAWYGHQRELREVADRLSPKSFSDLAREVEFEPGRFAGLLKAHLQHAGQYAGA